MRVLVVRPPPWRQRLLTNVYEGTGSAPPSLGSEVVDECL